MRDKRAGVVTAVLGSNLVNVATGPQSTSDPSSGNIPNVPYPPGYAPQVGDSVVIDYLMDTPFIVAVLTPNRSLAAQVSVVNSNPGGLTQISTVLVNPSTSTNPAITLVRTTPVTAPTSITVLPANSRTWSPDWPSWRTDHTKVGQGDYGSGENYGLWFYGSGAFSALTGHTVTGITMTVVRDSASGASWGPMQLHCYRHSYTTMPGSGPPTLTNPYDPAGANPSLGQTVTFALPLTWGQALQAGTSAGIAIASSDPNDSVVVLGLQKGSISGQLVITYT